MRGISSLIVVSSVGVVVGVVVEVFGVLEFGEVQDAQVARGSRAVAFNALAHRPRTH